jgi:hypothetical protein
MLFNIAQVYGIVLHYLDHSQRTLITVDVGDS